MMKCWAGLVAAVVLLTPAGAHGQTAWDSPLLLPPRPAPGFGIFLTDMHNGGIGLLGTWRSPVWNFGVRGGISEGAGGSDLAIFGGVDYTGPLHVATEDVPVDVDWVFGAGLGLNDGARISVPVGITAAHSIQTETARFTPFLTPRIVLDAFFASENSERGSDLGLSFAVDLGLDLRLAATGGPLDDMTIRIGVSLGDRTAIGLGLVF
jgi:hypothetical protein